MTVLLMLPTATVVGQTVASEFKQSCSSCHWIGGGRLIGPDLKDVTQRQERDWLISFIANPKGMLDALDPYAMKLKDEAKGAVMTNVPGMTRGLAEALLDLIEAESKLDSSQFMGHPTALEPFSQQAADAGLDIFTGRTSLTNNGPACVSCHSINADNADLGGQLGPELTGVFERLHGRSALTAWLSSPPTETMRSVFRGYQLEELEAKQLAMLFESISGRTGYNLNSTMYWIMLVLFALGGSALVLMLFGRVWKGRFRAVRQPLINETKKQRLM